MRSSLKFDPKEEYDRKYDQNTTYLIGTFEREEFDKTKGDIRKPKYLELSHRKCQKCSRKLTKKHYFFCGYCHYQLDICDVDSLSGTVKGFTKNE